LLGGLAMGINALRTDADRRTAQVDDRDTG